MVNKKSVPVIVAAIVIFITILSLKPEAFPLPLQKAYYYVSYNLPIPRSQAFLEKAHEATKIRADQDKNPYSFNYNDSQKDEAVIERDSVRCVACHGSMRQQENGKPKYYIHNKMLSVELIKFYCTNCHKKVDLGKRNFNRATITVDRKLCLNCHEWRNKYSLGQLKKVQGSKENDERRLHLFVLHGSDKKSGLQWVQRNHFKIARIVGVEKCRRCHIKTSELDFCGTACHSSPFNRSKTNR